MVVAIRTGGDHSAVRGWRRELPVPLAVAALLLLLAAPSPAATTIGYVAPGDPGYGTNSTFAFAIGPAYAVPPSGGVITSWSVNAGQPAASSDGRVVLRVVRTGVDPASGSLTATVVASSRAVFAAGIEHFATRIPVQGGERIGIYSPTLNTVFPAGAESIGCTAAGEGTIGSSYVEGQLATCGPGTGIDVSAVVEPDADEDGFGDETQDGCPDIPNRVAGCPGRYRGQDGGEKFELGVGYSEGSRNPRETVPLPGRIIERMAFDIRLSCKDGSQERTHIYGGVSRKYPIRIRADGTFGYRNRIVANRDQSGGKVEMRGTISAAKGKGTVRVLIKSRKHGECSGKSSWQANSA